MNVSEINRIVHGCFNTRNKISYFRTTMQYSLYIIPYTIYHTISYHNHISYYIICHTITYRIIPYHYHIIYHTTPYHSIPFHTISYHIYDTIPFKSIHVYQNSPCFTKMYVVQPKFPPRLY